MTDDHEISAMKERHREHGTAHDVLRWRGRCRCGAKSYMTYATTDAAKTALRRTHLISVAANSSDDSGNN